MQFLRLLRWPNLLIVALTQYLIRYGGLYPAYHANGISFGMGEGLFLLQVFLTMLVGAGGYLINDIYDYPIDRINKPTKIFINRIISERNAYRLYAAMGLLGYLGALSIDYALGLFYWGWLFPLSWLLLWWYSAQLKRLPFWGNLTVAFLCGLVNLLVWPPEQAAFAQLARQSAEAAQELRAIFLFYALFAFLSTLFREIVKDIEDLAGDSANGCRTLPIVFGESTAKAIALACGAMVLLALGAWLFGFRSYTNTLAWLYALLAILPLALFAFYQTAVAANPAQYHRASTAIKLLMLLGLCYLPILTWGSGWL